MRNRERQRENKRLEKKVVCPHHRCAGNPLFHRSV